MAQNNFLYRLPFGVFHETLFYFLDIVDITKLEGTGKIALNRELKKLAKCPMRLNGCDKLVVPSRVLENIFKRWFFLDRLCLLPGDCSLTFNRLRHLEIQAIVVKSLTIPCEGTFQEKMLLTFAGKDFRHLQCTNRYIRNLNFLQGASVSRVKYLSLTHCFELSEFSPQIFSQFKALTRLCLSYCYLLNDSELARVIQCTPNLIHLDIAYCEMLTNASMREIVRVLPLMQTLDVTGCTLITMRYIGRMHETCKNLKVVEFSDPEPLTLQTVHALNRWDSWVLAGFYSLEYQIVRSESEIFMATIVACIGIIWFHYVEGIVQCFHQLYCFALFSLFLILVYFVLLLSAYLKLRDSRFGLVYRCTLMLFIVFGWLAVPLLACPWLIEFVRLDIPKKFRGRFSHGWF